MLPVVSPLPAFRFSADLAKTTPFASSVVTLFAVIAALETKRELADSVTPAELRKPIASSALILPVTFTSAALIPSVLAE